MLKNYIRMALCAVLFASIFVSTFCSNQNIEKTKQAAPMQIAPVASFRAVRLTGWESVCPWSRKINDPFRIDAPAGWVVQPGMLKYRFRLLDGSCAIGWHRIFDDWFYFDSDGICQTGMLSWNGHPYYTDEFGRLSVGWKYLDGQFYYFHPAPLREELSESFMAASNKRYELFPEVMDNKRWLTWNRQFLESGPAFGQAATGWNLIGGRNFCFAENGVYDQNAELKRLVLAVDEASNLAAEAGDEIFVSGGTISSAAMKKLEDDLKKLEELDVELGFVLLDINSGASIMLRPKEYFYSASTLKGPFVCALGTFHAEDLKENEELVEKTISVSDNETYFDLYQIYGPQFMLDYMDWTTVDGDFPGEALYTDVRPKDLSKLWVGNLEFFREGSENAEWIRPFFRHSRFSFIDAALEWKYEVYSKPGWDYAVGTEYSCYNDAGIILKGETPYILAVLSNASLYIDNTVMHELISDLDRAHSELIR